MKKAERGGSDGGDGGDQAMTETKETKEMKEFDKSDGARHSANMCTERPRARNAMGNRTVHRTGDDVAGRRQNPGIG